MDLYRQFLLSTLIFCFNYLLLQQFSEMKMPFNINDENEMEEINERLYKKLLEESKYETDIITLTK